MRIEIQCIHNSLVQRLNEEVFTWNLAQCLTHKRNSISTLRGTWFVVSHHLNWDSKASKRQVEEGAAAGGARRVPSLIPQVHGA